MPHAVSLSPTAFDAFFAALAPLPLEDQRQRALELRDLVQQEVTRLKSAMEARRTEHLDQTRPMDWAWWRRAEQESRERGNQILRVQDFLTRVSRQMRNQRANERQRLEGLFMTVAEAHLEPALFQLLLARATDRLREQNQQGGSHGT